jgi:hypothetical protein
MNGLASSRDGEGSFVKESVEIVVREGKGKGSERKRKVIWGRKPGQEPRHATMGREWRGLGLGLRIVGLCASATGWEHSVGPFGRQSTGSVGDQAEAGQSLQPILPVGLVGLGLRLWAVSVVDWAAVEQVAGHGCRGRQRR